MSLVKHSQRLNRKPCRKCGQGELYWAHDTSRTEGQSLCVAKDGHPGCNVTGKWVLMEKDGAIHACHASKVEGPVPSDPWTDAAKALGEDLEAEKAAATATEETPSVSAETPTPVPAPPVSSDRTAAIAALLDGLMAAPQIDRAQVEAIAREVVGSVVFPTKTVVVKDGETREVEGTTHKSLSDVLTAVNAGEHVMMVGPAGTGKSRIARQVAEALGLDYRDVSLNPQLPQSQLVGYMQAEGKYVRTPFRDIYENGGVFHFDEFDNGNASILATINGALANGAMTFPDGLVKAHPDFKAIASANTYGRGADRSYVARQALDAATLDRFAVITVENDLALEYALAMGTGLEASQVDKVITYVRNLRESVKKHDASVVISPRATVGVCRLLAAGMSWNLAIESRVRKGISNELWAKLGG